MPELRWILLGLGVLFCLGLWWWEARRGRQATNSRAGLHPAEGLNATPIVREVQRRPAVEPPIMGRELPPWNHPTDDAEQDDEDQALEEGAGAAIAAGRPEPPRVEFEPYEPPAREPMIDIAAERPQRPDPGTWERIEPVIGDAASAVGRPLAAQSTAAAPPAPPAPQPEKIVTLRVAAPPLERFEGRTLVAALGAAGLEHGKFSIFHKHAVDGATLFSVASLVEPGTFDLEATEGRRFPGVSFFAVLTPGRDGNATLEDMLATARVLAASLHGMLQDERGAPLSPQRLADLRADVAAWMRRPQ